MILGRQKADLPQARIRRDLLIWQTLAYMVNVPSHTQSGYMYNHRVI